MTTLLVVSPATTRYRWEVELLSRSNQLHQVCDRMVWLSYHDQRTSQSHPDRTTDVRNCEKLSKTVGMEFCYYEDARPMCDYPTSVRPWLLSRWLDDCPDYQRETFFYADSDMIFTGPVVLPEVGPARWVGSETSHYAGIFRNLVNAGTAVSWLENFFGLRRMDFLRTPDLPGAQWVVCEPSPDVWWKVFEACEKVYTGLEPMVSESTRWLTDMWVTPWVLRSCGIDPMSSQLLDFASFDDDYQRFVDLPLYHNSLGKGFDGVFDKTLFVDHEPGGTELMVPVDKACRGYVEFIKHVHPSTVVKLVE